MTVNIWTGIAVMAVVTYLIRMIPLILFRKPITNPFLKSLLYYIPYAVLAALTFPAVFQSGCPLLAVLGGVIAAVGVAFFGGGLFSVACAAALVTWVITILL